VLLKIILETNAQNDTTQNLYSSYKVVNSCICHPFTLVDKGGSDMTEKKPFMKEVQGKADAAESFLLTIGNKKSRGTFILPIINFATEENSKEAFIIFHQDFNMIKEKLNTIKEPFDLVCDYTDDPTANYAGSVVSLGYPLIRIDSKNLKIVTMHPLVLKTTPDKLNVHINREQRESLIEMPVMETFPGNFQISKGAVIRRYYVIPHGFMKPLYVISCIIGEKKYTSVEMIDMTSFWTKPQVIYCKEHRSAQVTTNNYQKLIKRWTTSHT